MYLLGIWSHRIWNHVFQGSQKDPGILPRALDVVFKHIAGRQYENMDLKPYLSSDVQKLDSELVKVEKNAKAALFSLLKEVWASKTVLNFLVI